MRGALTNVSQFIRRRPIRAVVIFLCLVLITSSIRLYSDELSLKHPGPALVIAGLAVVVLLVGLAIDKFLEQADLPHIIGLKFLLKHWRSFEKFGELDGAIIDEQIRIVQQLVKGKGYKQIEFLQSFSGHKLERSAFLVRLDEETPLVLKFDTIGNIRKESNNFDTYVDNFLGQHPGRLREGWPPEKQWAKMPHAQLGAILYRLAQLGDNPPRTLGEHYGEISVDSIVDVLNEILRPIATGWWDHPRQDISKPSLFDEYIKLTRWNSMLKGMEDVLTLGRLDFSSLSEIEQKDSFQLLNNALPNPIYWVKVVFNDQRAFNTKCGNWANATATQRDSIVHGDFHAGNILIERGNSPPWFIDFSDVHIGPTVQDIASLEASIKFQLLSSNTLQTLDIDNIYTFETLLFSEQPQQALQALIPRPIEPPEDKNAELRKIWKAIDLLRTTATNNYMAGRDPRPYYLALLHATLPVLYYRDVSPWQKLYAFISAARLCERLTPPATNPQPRNS